MSAKIDAAAAVSKSNAGDYRDASILIVDDHGPMLKTVERILAVDGYRRIRTATDADTATALFAAEPPDLLLLDFNMPGTSGFALLESWRARFPQAEFATIFFSASDERAIIKRAFQLGAVDFVAKPIDPFELTIRVRNQAKALAFERSSRRQNERLEQLIAARTAKLKNAIGLLKETERRLTGALGESERSCRDKTAAFAAISHELRTPLNIVAGYAEMLKAEAHGPLGDAAYRDYVRQIDRAGAQLTRIVDDVLDLSKAEAGKLRIEVQPVDIGATVRAAAAGFAEQALSAKVALDVQIDPDLPIVNTDGGRVRQIVANLLSNAIKFTPAGGRVTLSAKRDGASGVMVLVVSDTGVGIAPEDLLIVLKPFGQIPSAQGVNPLARRQRGTGLGLPFSKKLTELLGGSLDIASKPGIGTAVTVRLPNLQTAPAADHPSEE